MEPIDRRITAAKLLALRDGPHAADAIAELLGVNHMPPILGVRTLKDIQTFVSTGDATLAAQLIHASSLRRQRARGPLAVPPAYNPPQIGPRG